MEAVDGRARPVETPSSERRRAADRAVALRFLVVFSCGFAAFQAVFAWLVAPSRLMRDWLAWNGRIAAALLGVLGFEVDVRETTLTYGASQVQIGVGCDGVQPIGLFVLAIVAFPASWRSKSRVLAIGVPALLALNLVRIGSLALLYGWSAHAFDWWHRVGWPAAFVALVFVGWAAWARRARAE